MVDAQHAEVDVLLLQHSHRDLLVLKKIGYCADAGQSNNMAAAIPADPAFAKRRVCTARSERRGIHPCIALTRSSSEFREVRCLAGAESREHPEPGRRVTVTGTVPDLRPYLRRAALAVAPMPYGAGIQNKVLEAMACATPVVASAQAGLALQARDGRDLVLAEGAEAFARAVLDLLAGEARRASLGRAGRRYVEEYHDWAAVGGRLVSIYDELVAQA